jgi:hypothetical protein
MKKMSPRQVCNIVIDALRLLAKESSGDTTEIKSKIPGDTEQIETLKLRA